MWRCAAVGSWATLGVGDRGLRELASPWPCWWGGKQGPQVPPTLDHYGKRQG